jgi:hypothetical protein
MMGTPITEENTRAALAACDRALAKLFELFSRPGVRKVWTTLDCLVYIPVRREDGSVDFVLDAEHAEREAWLDAMLGQLEG